MQITVNTYISVDVNELAKNMSCEELAALLSLVAERFDGEYKNRRELAEAMAEGTSETGARFLAEVISSTIYR